MKTDTILQIVLILLVLCLGYFISDLSNKNEELRDEVSILHTEIGTISQDIDSIYVSSVSVMKRMGVIDSSLSKRVVVYYQKGRDAKVIIDSVSSNIGELPLFPEVE